jgi:hypothetical protein
MYLYILAAYPQAEYEGFPEQSRAMAYKNAKPIAGLPLLIPQTYEEKGNISNLRVERDRANLA